MDRNIFYLCWVPDQGQNAPRVKHTTAESAKNEAQRLTAKTGKECYILEATHVIVPPEVPASTTHRLLYYYE